MPDLTGTSSPIELAPGGYQLRAPGLVGTAKEIDAQASATPATAACATRSY